MQPIVLTSRSGRLGRIVLAAVLGTALICGLLQWASTIKLFEDVRNTQAEGERFTSVPDYFAFQAAGEMIASGHGADIYDVDAIGEVESKTTRQEPGPHTTVPFRNPAFVALPFVGLSQLSYGTSLVVLAAVEVVLTFLVIAQGQRILNPATKQGRLLFLLGSLSFLPLAINVGQGQSSALLCLAYLVLIAAELKGRPRTAGVAMAFLLIKPQYAVLPVLWVLVRRRWETLASFAAGASVLALISVAVVGFGNIDAYPRSLIESRNWVDIYTVHPSTMYGWSGFIAQFIEYGSPLHSAITALVTLATLAVLARIWMQGARDEAGILRGASATLLASMLITPHINLHDLSLLLVVMVCAGAYLQRVRGLTSVDVLLPGLMAALLLGGPNLATFGLGNIYTPLESVALLWLWGDLRPRRVAHPLPALELQKAA
jgi:hypothetical protein